MLSIISKEFKLSPILSFILHGLKAFVGISSAIEFWKFLPIFGNSTSADESNHSFVYHYYKTYKDSGFFGEPLSCDKQIFWSQKYTNTLRAFKF